MRPVLVLALVLVVSGCGHTPRTAAPSTSWTVSGTLAQVGGPAGNPPGYPDGTVTLRSSRHVVTTPARHGRFSARVPTGRYTVTARASTYGDGVCRADQPVTVDRDVSGVQVLCQMR